MQRFKDYLQEDVGRGYCYVSPDKKSARVLMQWAAKEAHLENVYPVSDLHCTLIYDDRNKKFEIPMAKEIYAGTPKGVKMLGENKDTLTILLDSPELQKRHRDLIRSGYTRTYASYLPHVSIKAEASYDDFLNAKRAFPKLKAKLKELTFTNEKWKLIESEE